MEKEFLTFGRRIIVVEEPGVIHEWRSQEERLKYEIELCKKKIKQNEAMLKDMKKKKNESLRF